MIRVPTEMVYIQAVILLGYDLFSNNSLKEIFIEALQIKKEIAQLLTRWHLCV